MNSFTKLLTLSLAAGTLICTQALAADDNQTGGVSESVAYSHDGAEHGVHNHHYQHEERFRLSDEQLEKMGSLKDQYRLSVAQQEAELCNMKGKMADILTKPSIDRTAATDLQTKINSLQDELSMKRLNYKMDKMALLTPEQKHEMRHHMLMAKLMGHHFGHQGHGGHGEHGGHFGQHPGEHHEE